MDDELVFIKQATHKAIKIETHIQQLESQLASWKEHMEERREEAIRKRKELERFKSLSEIRNHLKKYAGAY
jgi:flagellar biosynthesis chaperone FliJ